MSYQSYICLARLGGASHYFLWQTDLETDRLDRVVVDDGGRIASFATEIEARTHANARGEPAATEPPVVYDLDRLAAWCDHPAEVTLDCEAILDVWNLFSDLGDPAPAVTNAFRFAASSAGASYEKLLFGTNLPAMTPAGSSYTPLWSAAELDRLSQTLRLGLQEFASRLPSIGPAE
jgi:hypothetical protein